MAPFVKEGQDKLQNQVAVFSLKLLVTIPTMFESQPRIYQSDMIQCTFLGTAKKIAVLIRSIWYWSSDNGPNSQMFLNISVSNYMVQQSVIGTVLCTWHLPHWRRSCRNKSQKNRWTYMAVGLDDRFTSSHQQRLNLNILETKYTGSNEFIL